MVSVGTPFTLNFGTALDTITHLDDTSSAIDTRVYLDDIKDINKVLVMGKIHIGYSTWNIFASVLLIKKLYVTMEPRLKALVYPALLSLATAMADRPPLSQ